MSAGFRFRSRWWGTVLLMMTMIISMVVPASAAAPATSSEAINLLVQYNLVRGDEQGNLRLGEPITRAQMAVILVRITGHESEADGMKNMGLFSDMKGHWADGPVAAARVYGLFKGFEDGSFRPEEPVTYGQALTLVERLVGREPDPNNWPASALYAAVDLNVVPEGFTGVAMLNAPAVRGQIFASVARALTTVKTPQGNTYFQKYVDSTPPELNVAAATTVEASYQLTGTVKGASQVLVNGQAAALTGETFNKTLSLNVGANRITVEAQDLAGNKTVREVVITRGTAASSVTITGPSHVGIGGTAAYQVKAFDANGSEVSAAGMTARVVGSIGTFDVATGTFRAGQVAGTGKIEVSLGNVTDTIDIQVSGLSAAGTTLAIRPVTNVAPSKPMTVEVEVRNTNGELVTDDFGRTVTLSSSGLTGVTITPAVATTVGGVATFTVRGTTTGEFSVSASSQGLSADAASVQFTTATHVSLVADPNRLATTGGATAKIRAELRDEAGNLMLNKTGEDIYLDVNLDGAGFMLNSRIRIAQGASSSAQTLNDAVYSPGALAGVAKFTATMSSTHKFSIDSTSITTYSPTAAAGTRFVVTPLTGRVGMGEKATFVVQLLDASNNPISNSDFAFQVAVDTSNNEAKVDGVPAGMTVRVGANAGANPVSDGQTGGSDVIARTSIGSTLIEVEYDRPGEVTLKVVPAVSTDTAYASDGTVDKATGSSSGWVTDDSKAKAVYTATPNTVKVTVDSEAYGKGQAMGANKAGASRSMTLHAYVAYGETLADPAAPRYWVPSITTYRLGLFKNGGSTPISTLNTSDGTATFTVSAPSAAGEDTYVIKDMATSTALADSGNVYIRTDKLVPDAPGQAFLRGMPSNTYSAVQTDDTYVDIDLPVDAAQRSVIVKLYADDASATGGSTLVYTSVNAIDVSGGSPKLTVPKSNLPAGLRTYRVMYKNGAGDSVKGAPSDPVTNYTVTSSVAISSARFDAVAKKLYLIGTGFAANEAIEPGLISIKDPSIAGDAGTAYLSGAAGLYVNAGLYTLDLTYANDLNKLMTFGGTGVKLSASAGWYTRASGQMAGADLSNPVTPMARMDYAVYDKANHRVIINGQGFSIGTLVKSKVTVGGVKLDATGISVTRYSDSQLWVTLNSTASAALDGDTALQVVADNGWYVSDITGTYIGKMAAQSASIYAYVRLSSVSYNNGGATGTGTGTITITGDGFANGQFGGGKVYIRDNSRNEELVLTPGNIATDGRSVTFTITGADKTTFESSFGGGDVYLIAAPGWFQAKVSGTQYRDVYGIAQGPLRFTK